MYQINPPEINFENIGIWIATSGLKILIIFILAFVASRFLGIATRYLTTRIKRLNNVDNSELDKRTATISNVVHNAGLAVIVITALLMILHELTIDVTPMLASVGIVGLALGLGAQTLVQDIIGGIIILVEGQFQVGDMVELQGKTGMVEDMTLRVTSVRDFQGDLHIIPNGEIRLVTNKGREWSRAIVDVNIFHEEDIAQAVGALEEIGRWAYENEEVRRVLLEQPTVLGVEAVEDGKIRLRLVVKTIATEQWGVQRRLRRRVQETFTQHGIRLALPRREIMMVGGSSNMDETDETDLSGLN